MGSTWDKKKSTRGAPYLVKERQQQDGKESHPKWRREKEKMHSVGFLSFLKRPAGGKDRLIYKAGGCHCCVNSPVSSIPLQFYITRFSGSSKWKDPKFLFSIFIYYFFFFLRKKKKKKMFHLWAPFKWRETLHQWPRSLTFRDGEFFCYLFLPSHSSRSYAAIQKKREEEREREKRPSCVCYYDFAGGQTMMMARPGVPS